jgi:hypothetical protein
MGLGKRCDEIVRLIDETLADLAIEPADTPAGIELPVTAVVRLPAPGPGPDPDLAAAGF